MSDTGVRNSLKLALETAELFYGKNKIQLSGMFIRLKEAHPKEVFSRLQRPVCKTDKEVFILHFTHCKLGLFYNNKKQQVSGISLYLNTRKDNRMLAEVFNEKRYNAFVASWAAGKSWRNERFLILEQFPEEGSSFLLLERRLIQKAITDLVLNF